MTEFEKYLKQAREEFAYEVSKYTVENNLALRTASDSLLIAFAQATEKAINYSQCCTQLKEKESLTFDEFKDEFYCKERMGIYESKASGMFYSLNDLNKRYQKYRLRF